MVLGLAGWIGWRWARGGTLAMSAATLDRRGELDDEIKSAYSFVDAERVSPWIDLHIARASRTASDLDERELVPIEVPKRLVFLNIAVLAVGFVLLPGKYMASPIGSDSSKPSQVAEKARDIEEMLQSADLAGDLDSTEEDNRRAETLRRLDDTLRRLEEGEMPLSEGLQSLAETQNDLTEAGLDAAGLEEALSDVARDLEGEGTVGELAEALEQGRLEEAVELLKELAEKAGSSEEMDPSLERLKDAESRSASLEEWMDALKKAVEALEQGDQQAAEERFSEAAEGLEAMNAELKSKKQMSLAGQQLEELRDALSRDVQLRKLSEQQASQELKPMDEEAQALAEALADLPMPEDPAGGNPDGLPMGPAGGPEPPPPSEEPETLEFQLEREMLGEEEEEEELDPEELIERASREEESEIEYTEIERETTYREADVMSPEPIPWRYRQIIKSYFESIQRKTKP
jgi:hypothetical protein